MSNGRFKAEIYREIRGIKSELKKVDNLIKVVQDLKKRISRLSSEGG